MVVDLNSGRHLANLERFRKREAERELNFFDISDSENVESPGRIDEILRAMIKVSSSFIAERIGKCNGYLLPAAFHNDTGQV